MSSVISNSYFKTLTLSYFKLKDHTIVHLVHYNSQYSTLITTIILQFYVLSWIVVSIKNKDYNIKPNCGKLK